MGFNKKFAKIGVGIEAAEFKGKKWRRFIILQRYNFDFKI